MATKKPTPKKVVPNKSVVANTTPPSPPADKKATPSKKQVVANAKAASSPTDKRLSVQQQMAALQLQIEALNAQTVEVLKGKISDTKRILRGYELELESLTGKRSAAPKKARRA